MKLSRKIPAYIKTIKFNWCKKDFMEMSDTYKRIRTKFRKGTMLSCFWCGHELINGEMLALAQPKKGVNKVLCQECVLKIEGEI